MRVHLTIIGRPLHVEDIVVDDEEKLYSGWSAPEAVFHNARHYGFTPLKILLSVRTKGTTNWLDLCREFGIRPDEVHDTRTSRFLDSLCLLSAAGLIEIEEQKDNYGPIEGKITISRHLMFVQQALNISIRGLASLDPVHSLMVTPQFRYKEPSEIFDVFVLMPFGGEFDDLYVDVLKPAVNQMNLSIGRADDMFGPSNIVDEIWSSILSAKALLIDCTGRNPNVFYELGLGHAIGRSTILIARNDSDVPFDIRHLRYIRYEYTPRGAITLTTALQNSIRTVLEELDDS